MDAISKALGTVLAALVMCGCTSSADEGPGGSSTSSPSPSSTTPAEGTPTQEPTEEPTVAPATGKVIKVKGMKVNIPAGWGVGRMPAVIQAYGYLTTQVGTDVALFRFPQLLTESLDELARDIAKRSSFDRELERKADVVVDNQVVIHLSGVPNKGVHVDLFSTLRAGQQLDLEFTFGTGETRSEREEIIQSVLATWDFIP